MRIFYDIKKGHFGIIFFLVAAGIGLIWAAKQDAVADVEREAVRDLVDDERHIYAQYADSRDLTVLRKGLLEIQYSDCEPKLQDAYAEYIAAYDAFLTFQLKSGQDGFDTGHSAEAKHLYEVLDRKSEMVEIMIARYGIDYYRSSDFIQDNSDH